MTLEQQVKKTIKEIPDFPTKGIMFKDILPVLKQPELSRAILNRFEEQMSHLNIDVICAIESRGFFFGTLLAHHFNLPFVPIRKAGKLPGDTFAYSYNLEYGTATVEMQRDSISAGKNVMIHDDLLATGGTALAAAELIRSVGGKTSAFSFLVSLDFLEGYKKLLPYSEQIFSIASYTT